MLLRVIGLSALALVLASYLFGLHRDGNLRSWLDTTPSIPKEIVFDNGSFRDAPSPAASEPTQVALSAPGALRKCVRGDRVTYSNLTCPPGFKERQVSSDKVTVISTDGTRKPESKVQSESAQKTLHNALDLKTDDQLRQRMIDRAVAAEAK
jgi:hypothetical protein